MFRSSRLIVKIPLVSGVVLLTVSCSVILSWIFEIRFLLGFGSDVPTMKVNTALGFLFSGLSLCTITWKRGNQRIARALGRVVAALGLLTIWEYFSGQKLGIDELLLRDYTSRLGLPPGRMAFLTAVNFALLGLALSMLPRRLAFPRLINVLTLPAGCIAFFSLGGYLFGAPTPARLGLIESMAPNTTILFAVLCAGIVFSMPKDGLAAILQLPGISGTVARRLLPAALLAPVVIGLLRLWGQRAGLYGTEFGVAIFAVSTAIVLVLSILWSVGSLTSLEAARNTAMIEIQEQRDSLARVARLVDASNDAIIAMDSNRVITSWNKGAETLYGWNEKEAVGNVIHHFLETVSKLEMSEIDEILKQRGRWDGELQHTRRDGVRIAVESRHIRLPDDAGVPGSILEINRDVTERKALQEQLLQSQKLESLGTLTAGIAHDFNNILTVINGYSALILEEATAADARTLRRIKEIGGAGQRAADLTRQLLTFSRRQITSPRNLVLSEAVRDIEKMLRRLIRADIDLILKLDPLPAIVYADPGQVEQVLVNLVVNARDAMPRGGRLVIETSVTMIDETYSHAHLALNKGLYAQLVVSDTGEGMTPEVKTRIFEPFFTTKEVGKGTGLGLSTVYGIVRDSGGAIFVYSEPGHGTSFKIFFPAAEGSVESRQSSSDVETFPGTETILLVEDEEELRVYVQETLESRGFRVLTAANGEDALDAARQYAGKIHLLLTDVIMPRLGGVDLAAQMTSIMPDIPVVFMSGYTDRLLKQKAGVHFIEKPFTPIMLLKLIRDVLSARNS